jgi:hypothetical protein
MIRALLSLLLALCLASGCQEVPGPPERIILVVVDTLRADHLGAYGGALEVPHFDGLAQRGQVFPNSLSSYHQTSMSMASVFTGLTPSLEGNDPPEALEWNRGNRCGMARFRKPGDEACLPSVLTTLAEDLSEAGYWTSGVTGNPLLFRPAGYDQGFEHWVEVGIVPGGPLNNKSRAKHAHSRAGDAINQAVVEALASRPNDHFFLYVHYLDVHDWYLLGHKYREAVEIQDAIFGELLALLDAHGLLEGTTVILTSDHGEELGEVHPVRPLPAHLGNPSYESVLRVPLVVAPPVFDDTAQWITGTDLRSLIRRLAGLEPLERRSEADELFVSEVKYRTYREGRFKSMWPREGGAPLLLDLVGDPGETRSLTDERGDVLERHRDRLGELSRELGVSRDTPLDDADREEDLRRLRVLGYIE